MHEHSWGVIRFHKRYYIFTKSSLWPDCLSRLHIPKKIFPAADGAEYQAWLAAHRKFAEEWEAAYEGFLSVQPGSEQVTSILTEDFSLDRSALEIDLRYPMLKQGGVTTALPDFMQKQLPSLIPPLKRGTVDWIHVVDLDRELYSLNYKDHYKLQEVVCDDRLVDGASLPKRVPMDGPTDRGIQDGRQIVIAKNIKDIPWRQRHGPILRAIIFHFWSCFNEKSLAATYLHLSPEDLPFREMAYAILCLAAGGRHINLLPSRNVRSNDVFAWVDAGPEYNGSSEFVSFLASGAHLQGSSPGTSPESTIYWLDNVLVVVTAQLYRLGAADEAISHIVLYCQKNHSTQYVDAVLISIEHVVLVHVVPGEKVQHTEPMPLLDRDAKPWSKRISDKIKRIKKKQDKVIRKTIQKVQLRNEGVELGHGMNSDEEDESALYTTQVDGNINFAFYALVHLFEAAACKQMPVTKATAGRLPNEVYSEINKQITDMETREAVRKVSRTFRQFCQEDLLFIEGSIIKPSLACQSCDEPSRLPNWFEKYDVDSGIQLRVACSNDAMGLLEATLEGDDKCCDRDNPSRKVAIGTEWNKKSLLAAVAFKFMKV